MTKKEWSQLEEELGFEIKIEGLRYEQCTVAQAKTIIYSLLGNLSILEKETSDND